MDAVKTSNGLKTGRVKSTVLSLLFFKTENGYGRRRKNNRAGC